jgi:urease accessory protein
MAPSNLLSLLHLCDPALPIGSFSHSAGLETYVQQNSINDKYSAREFIIQQLSQNIYYTDAALASIVYDAACANDLKKIITLDELCNAVRLPMETRFASNKLGLRLLKIFESNGDFILPNAYKEQINLKQAFGHYCISFSLLAHAMNIGKKEMLVAFYYNAATAFITNAVKLIPLGQLDGQETLMSLFPLINELAHASLIPDEGLIGYCCTGFDIRCMQHEQLYSRLYMS